MQYTAMTRIRCVQPIGQRRGVCGERFVIRGWSPNTEAVYLCEKHAREKLECLFHAAIVTANAVSIRDDSKLYQLDSHARQIAGLAAALCEAGIQI